MIVLARFTLSTMDGDGDLAERRIAIVESDGRRYLTIDDGPMTSDVTFDGNLIATTSHDPEHYTITVEDS